MTEDGQQTVSEPCGETMGIAARCGCCGREWWLVHTDDLPVRFGYAMRLMREATCPGCGNTGRRRNSPKIYWLNRPPQRKQRPSHVFHANPPLA